MYIYIYIYKVFMITTTFGGAKRLMNILPRLAERSDSTLRRPHSVRGGSGVADAPPGSQGVWGRHAPRWRGGPGGRQPPPASIIFHIFTYIFIHFASIFPIFFLYDNYDMHSTFRSILQNPSLALL